MRSRVPSAAALAARCSASTDSGRNFSPAEALPFTFVRSRLSTARTRMSPLGGACATPKRGDKLLVQRSARLAVTGWVT
eukprot:1195831-Pyramimonas_sp.AAC.1